MTTCPDADIMNNKTQFDDLNLDCQMLIFDHFNLSTLVVVAETSKYYQSLAADVFKRNFAKMEIQIFTPFLKHSTIFGGENYTATQNVDIATKLVRNFGYLIDSLKIGHYSHYDEQTKQINKMINLYCSETLMRISIQSYKENIFDSMKVPFKKVVDVYIDGRYDKLGGQLLNLNDIFPSMHRLFLNYVKISDLTSIELTFSHLQYLHIEIYQYEDIDRIDDAAFKRFIKKNPQIRTMKLLHGSRRSLEFISKFSTNLETLKIKWYDERVPNEGRQQIYFGNVKRLEMEHSSQSIPENITFSNLIEFKSDAHPNNCHKWIDFVDQNRNVSILRLTGRYINNAEFSMLVTFNLSLTEDSLKCDSDVNGQTIIQFIENSKDLRQINLLFNQRDTNSLKPITTSIRSRKLEGFFLVM